MLFLALSTAPLSLARVEVDCRVRLLGSYDDEGDKDDDVDVDDLLIYIAGIYAVVRRRCQ